jgi:hypothetical protein
MAYTLPEANHDTREAELTMAHMKSQTATVQIMGRPHTHTRGAINSPTHLNKKIIIIKGLKFERSYVPCHPRPFFLVW